MFLFSVTLNLSLRFFFMLTNVCRVLWNYDYMWDFGFSIVTQTEANANLLNFKINLIPLQYHETNKYIIKITKFNIENM